MSIYVKLYIYIYIYMYIYINTWMCIYIYPYISICINILIRFNSFQFNSAIPFNSPAKSSGVVLECGTCVSELNWTELSNWIESSNWTELNRRAESSNWMFSRLYDILCGYIHISYMYIIKKQLQKTWKLRSKGCQNGVEVDA